METEHTTLNQEQIIQEEKTVENIPSHNTEEIQEQRNSQEINFVALRKAKEAAEKERDEYLKRLKEIEETRTPVKEVLNEKEESISDDDIVEGRHLRKIEEKLRSYEHSMQTTAAEIQLKSRYPDFDTVVNKENIEKLRQTYPEIAATISQSQDMYSKAISAYTLIKKLNIDTDGKFDSQREAVTSNINKPRPLNSVSPQQGNSPLEHANAFANGLTPDLKKKLFKEMMALRRSS